MTNPIAAQTAILAVALKARTGGLTALDVDQARETAEALLPEGDPQRAAMIAFATGYERLRHDAYGLQKLGEALQNAQHVALNPAAAPARVPLYGGIDD